MTETMVETMTETMAEIMVETSLSGFTNDKRTMSQMQICPWPTTTSKPRLWHSKCKHKHSLTHLQTAW
jgi:hypothetical protein